jgi:hypothetical protein
VKKSKAKDQDQKQTPRRLSLNRETILILNDPALLEIPRGQTGSDVGRACHRTTGIATGQTCRCSELKGACPQTTGTDTGHTWYC